MNSLDPRAKRLRAARHSVAQAKSALTGARLIAGPLATSTISPAADFLHAVDQALQSLTEAEQALDRVAHTDPSEE